MAAATHQLQDFTFHVARFDQFRIRQTSQGLPQLNVFFSGLKCYNALTGSRDEFARIEREGLQFRKVGFGSVDTCLGQNNRIKFSVPEFLNPRRYVSADIVGLDVGSVISNLSLTPLGRGSYPGIGRKFEQLVVLKIFLTDQQNVRRIGPLGKSRDHKTFRTLGGQILERMDCYVYPFLQQGYFDLPGEETFAFQLVKTQIFSDISLSFYNSNFTFKIVRPKE